MAETEKTISPPLAIAPDLAEPAVVTSPETFSRIKEIFAKAGVPGAEGINDAAALGQSMQLKETQDKLAALPEQDKMELYSIFAKQAEMREEELRKERLALPPGHPERIRQEEVDALAQRFARGDKEAIAKVDQNHDGLISSQEMAQSGLSMRQVLGIDKNTDITAWVKENSAEVDGQRIVFGKRAHDQIEAIADQIHADTTDKGKQAAIDKVADLFDKNGDGKLDETEAKMAKAAMASQGKFAAVLKEKGITDPDALVADIRKTMAQHNVAHTPAETHGAVATTAPAQKVKTGGHDGPG